jgi:hypothetical protein
LTIALFCQIAGVPGSEPRIGLVPVGRVGRRCGQGLTTVASITGSDVVNFEVCASLRHVCACWSAAGSVAAVTGIVMLSVTRETTMPKVDCQSDAGSAG